MSSITPSTSITDAKSSSNIRIAPQSFNQQRAVRSSFRRAQISKGIADSARQKAASQIRHSSAQTSQSVRQARAARSNRLDVVA